LQNNYDNRHVIHNLESLIANYHVLSFERLLKDRTQNNISSNNNKDINLTVTK